MPLRLDDCEIPESFGDIHYQDLSEKNALNKVINAVRVELGNKGGSISPRSDIHFGRCSLIYRKLLVL